MAEPYSFMRVVFKEELIGYRLLRPTTSAEKEYYPTTIDLSFKIYVCYKCYVTTHTGTAAYNLLQTVLVSEIFK